MGGTNLADLNLHGKKILIVEDDFVSAQLIKEIFLGTQVDMVHVLTASGAIEQIQNSTKFDLVLLDIQLPDLNGLQVAKTIKAKRPALPIIVQTAYAFDSYKQRSKEVGCDYFITKPLDAFKLHDILKKIFKK